MAQPAEVERNIGQTGGQEIALRLALTGSALEMFDQVEEAATGNLQRIQLGIAKAQAGFNIDSIITHLQEEDSKGRRGVDLVTDIARLQAEQGEFEAAYTTIEPLAKPHNPDKFYAGVARAKARHGQSPQPELQSLRDFYTQKDKPSDPSIGDTFLYLASLGYETTGVIPSDILALAEERIEAYLAQKHQAYTIATYGRTIGGTYVTLKMYDRAVQMVDRMTVASSDTVIKVQIDLLHAVARAQIADGQYEEALRLLERIPDLTNAYGEACLGHYRPTDLAITSALIGYAQTASGNDGSSSFEEALAWAERAGDSFIQGGSSTRPTVDAVPAAYTAIGAIQHEAGISPKDTYQKALEKTDAITDDYYLDTAEKMLTYEDLAVAAAQSGHLDIAATVIERLASYAEDARFNYDVMDSADTVISIASAQAHAGLHPKEIRALTADQLAEAMKSGSEHVAKALAYIDKNPSTVLANPQ